MARMLSTSANRLARVAQGRADTDFSGRPSSCPRAGHERLDRRSSFLRACQRAFALRARLQRSGASMPRWPRPRVGLDGRPACPQDRHPPTLARGPAPTPALKPGAGVRRAGGVHPFPFTGTVPRAHRASRRPRLTAPPSQLTPAGGSPSFTVGPDGPVIHRPPSGMGYATATTSGRPAPSTARQDATASMRRTPRPSPAPVPRPARRTHGRGGDPAATGAPHVCGRYTLQRQFSSTGVDKIG